MILKDGSVKVADFGIARLLSVQNTLTQEALGSVHYISPEQAKGGNVDTRSDIYSVGVVMYEMLTSRLPFVGESAVSVAIQHISAIPLMPRDINPDVPIGLEDITMHAMEPDLDMRFSTAEEMLSDLEEFRKNPSIMFNYVLSVPTERKPAEIDILEETRVIPKEAIAKAEVAPVQSELAIARMERPLPEKRRAKAKPDLTADEYRAVKTRASSTSILVGIFSIMVFLIVVVVFMWQFLLKDIFRPQDREQIIIPNFINRRHEDIKANEEYSDMFDFIEREVYSEDFSPGIVISQNPAADNRMSPPLPGRKTRIELVISLGSAPPREMPDLIGKLYSVAYNELISLGLDLDIEGLQVASDEPVDYVIETVPASGEMLARGYRVTIRYSGGPSIVMVSVPEMILPTTETAFRSAFRGLELELDIDRYTSHDHAEGTVTFIHPQGIEVPAGSRIIVHISAGPPEVIPTEEPPTDPPPTDPPDPPPTDPPDHLTTDPTDYPPAYTPDPPTGEDGAGGTG